MAHEDFRRALTQVYRDHPCQVLAYPLWRALAELDAYETSVAVDSQGVNRLEAWNAQRLLIYWRRDQRQPSLLVSRRLAYQQAAIIHQDFLDAPTVAGFKTFRSQYRLLYRPGAPLEDQPLPVGFRFADIIGSPEDLEGIAAQVAQGGEALVDVQSWLNSPAFAADLWLWLVDEATGQPIGLAVAEIDPQIREAVLLWVHVTPEYRGRGLGRGLVHEMLRRVGQRADFVTVAGPVEDRDNPGAFFRRCGFGGQDVWWLLSRES